MNDNPLLTTPGEMISEAREAQELTIAQLSERTKIPPPVLAALELDEYHKISGPLYIKSFLRTCAVDLGLDPQTVLSLYNKISGERKSGPVGPEMVWKEEEVKISRVGLPWPWIIMVAGFVAVLVGLGLFALRGCGNGGSPRDGGSFTAVDESAPEEMAAVVVSGDSATSLEFPHESLDPTRTEPDLPQRTEEAAEETTPSGEDGRIAPFSLHDSQDMGWLLAPQPPAEETGMVPEDPAPDVAEIVEEAPPVIVAVPKEIEPEEIEREDPQVDLPVVAPVDSAWPLVLRIVCDAPQKIQVKRDGDRDFSEVRWPGELEDAPPVPAAGFEAGRAYRQSDRLVVFWGAEDHFSLKLVRVRGVEVSINGRVRDIGRLRSGQELILDAHFARSTPRR